MKRGIVMGETKAADPAWDLSEWTVIHSGANLLCMKCGWWIRVAGSDKVLKWANRQFEKHACVVEVMQ